ncbi:hypothetical protein HB904_03870 [Listeria booriae]|uniref:Uncharacterized protein n=1 Tax=Listeria booriae TaxID=1552123 RepID=A0A842ABI1_9LIST|nr:hypothetical protein [Listeria booriae]MBC1615309.1 hypothetical protein [Listeria booriae]
MMAVIEAFQTLFHDDKLNELMNEIRGEVLDEQTIYQLEIDEDYLKIEKVPLIRIEDIDSSGTFYSDDKRGAVDETVQISTMTVALEDLDKLLAVVDSAMNKIDFEQYKSKTYKEPDLGLMYNSRAYRRINYL